MRKVSLWVLGLALLGGPSGCDSTDASLEKKDPMSAKVAATKEITSILEGIKDDASAEAALPRLEKAVTRFQEAGKKFNSMMTSSKEEANELVVKYAVDLLEGMVKIQTAAEKAGKAAPGKKAKIMEVLKKEEPTEK